MADVWWTRLARGTATHLSSHARHPRPATSDKHTEVRPSPADSLKESQLAARSGPSPPRRTPPTEGMRTASLIATATPRELPPTARAHRAYAPDATAPPECDFRWSF